MKKFILFATMLSFLGFYSCQNDIVSEDVNPSETDNNTSFELSNEEVTNLLTHYFQRLHNSSPATKSLVIPQIKGMMKEHYVNAVATRASGTEQPGFTICNVDLQCEDSDGFAIVLADKRLPLVLAYSPRGNYADLKKTQNEALIDYVESIPASVEHVLAQPRYLHITYLNFENKWAHFPYPSSCDDIYTSTDIRGARHDVAYLYETTLWGQTDPYNKYMPFIANDTINHQLVGCVAIALSNVMSYFKHPIRYNWDIMTAVQNIAYNNFGPRGAADTIAKLLREVADTLHTDYRDTISTATIADCYRALKHYQYSCDSSSPYDLDVIGASVKNKCPVIAFGQTKTGNTGHSFTIRGYWDIVVTEEMKQDTSTYLYDDGTSIGVTWGNAGGWGDGWYLVKWGDKDISFLGLAKYDPQTTASGTEYKYNLCVIANIKPEK